MAYLTYGRKRKRDVSVDAHEGRYGELLVRHERECRRTHGRAEHPLAAAAELAPCLMERIADSRTFRVAWDDCVRGGEAPGPNGLHYRDLDEVGGEVWSLLRTLAKAITAGTYRPGSDRVVQVPKPGKGGHRELRLGNIEHRPAGRAALLVLQPVLDPTFAAGSFGSRPAPEPRLRALAHAERQAFACGRRWWVVADVEKAFDNVPHAPLIEAFRKRLPDDDLVEFVGRLIENDACRGLRQGHPLSPLLLNVYLDHFLDHPLRRLHPDAGLARYLDDVLIACKNLDEAIAAHSTLTRLLTPAGLRIKEPVGQAVHGLHPPDALPFDWLGFQLRPHRTGLAYRISGRSWATLAARLATLHAEPDAPLRAGDVLTGWLGQLGPAYDFERRPGVFDRLERLAAEHGFTELPTRFRLKQAWLAGRHRWFGVRGGRTRAGRG